MGRHYLEMMGIQYALNLADFVYMDSTEKFEYRWELRRADGKESPYQLRLRTKFSGSAGEFSCQTEDSGGLPAGALIQAVLKKDVALIHTHTKQYVHAAMGASTYASLLYHHYKLPMEVVLLDLQVESNKNKK